jgi:hypothetical protein
MVVDTDEMNRAFQAKRIEDLRKQLESLWPPHELTDSERVRVIAVVISILGPKRSREGWIDRERIDPLLAGLNARTADFVALDSTEEERAAYDRDPGWRRPLEIENAAGYINFGWYPIELGIVKLRERISGLLTAASIKSSEIKDVFNQITPTAIKIIKRLDELGAYNRQNCATGEQIVDVPVGKGEQIGNHDSSHFRKARLKLKDLGCIIVEQGGRGGSYLTDLGISLHKYIIQNKY